MGKSPFPGGKGELPILRGARLPQSATIGVKDGVNDRPDPCVMNDMTAAPLAPIAPLCRVALLVDGENLAAGQAGAILDLAGRHGDLLIRRVYGKLTDLQAKGWAMSHGFRLMPAASSKNSADLLLSIDAMELALEGWADCIAIAASDNDYTHVALKLRERGFPVHGLIADTCRCADLRAAYHTVTNLPQTVASPAPEVTVPPPVDRIAAQVIQLLKASATAEPTGLPLQALGTQMFKSHGFHIGTTPDKTWRAFLTKHPALFMCDPKGPQARVRLKP